jgi:uncharacterized repeat protein (TIGR03803 family)
MKTTMKKITLWLTLLLLLEGISGTAQFTKIHDFDGTSDGGYPFCNLYFDGTFLYGVTIYGGLYGNGTIFKVKPNGTEYTTIFDFNAEVSGFNAYATLISDGTYLYGTTKGSEVANIHGSVYKIKPDGTEFSTLLTFTSLNGSTPWSGLYLIGDVLYGMTMYGAQGSTIYKLKTDGSDFATIFIFTESTSGYSPYGELIYDGTYLYGTTAGFAGNVFKILPDGTGFTTLVNFGNAPNGNFPYGSLISDGTFLYGTTGTGGVYDMGTVFKVKHDGSEYQQLFSFSGTNGQQPMDNLVQLGDYIYGMTMFGGTSSYGTVFRIKADGTGFSKLLDFDGTNNGCYPRRSVITDGTALYGMTSSCGANNWGVIFKLIPENLGNTEVSPRPEMVVYPNPTQGLITIAVQSVAQYQIEVYNILGVLITTQTATSQQTTVDLTHQPAGVYIVKVSDDNQNTIHQKIVIH